MATLQNDARRVQSVAAQVTNQDAKPAKRLLEGVPGEISPVVVRYLLLVCCFVTGLTDTTLFNAYGTFVSMQTGNTIFIALGTSGQNTRPYGWARSLCSLGCFSIGGLAFARGHRLLGGIRRRHSLLASFVLQTICVTTAAALIQAGIVDGAIPSSSHGKGGDDLTELIVVALLSFQAAGQLVISRGFGVVEIPTVVITILLCDLVSDEHLLARVAGNSGRNRRVMAFVLTLIGAICGGWMTRMTGAVQPSLWLVAGIKAVFALLLMAPL